MYGPFQYGYSSVISTWLESLYFPKDRKPFMEGDGTQARDFCFIDDAVNGIMLAIHSKNKFSGDVINIASGAATSLMTLKEIIESLSKKKVILEKRPERIGEVKYSVADISKAKLLLGYSPKFTLEQGIRKTLKWFESRSDGFPLVKEQKRKKQNTSTQ
jgi:nucleoside-diphosphate-sugar epimerase